MAFKPRKLPEKKTQTWMYWHAHRTHCLRLVSVQVYRFIVLLLFTFRLLPQKFEQTTNRRRPMRWKQQQQQHQHSLINNFRVSRKHRTDAIMWCVLRLYSLRNNFIFYSSIHCRQNEVSVLRITGEEIVLLKCERITLEVISFCSLY